MKERKGLGSNREHLPPHPGASAAGVELLQVKNAHETFFGEYQLQVLYKINAQMESHNNNQNVIEQFDN